MNWIAFIMLVLIITILSILLLRKGINSASISVVATLYFFLTLLYYVDPTAITELSFGAVEIKQDIERVKTIRDEIKTAEKKIKDIAQLNAEIRYLSDLIKGYNMGQFDNSPISDQRPMVEEYLSKKRNKIIDLASDGEKDLISIGDQLLLELAASFAGKAKPDTVYYDSSGHLIILFDRMNKN